MTPQIDIIGDVHGEWHALQALGRELGYDVDNRWEHPERRFPLFLGDLTDRGTHSFEVASLVLQLVLEKRAACLMGNHEYNLVAWRLELPGYDKPKPSNHHTIKEIESNQEKWQPILNFFRSLPLAYALPDLRIIHACWHQPSLAVVEQILAPQVRPRGSETTADWLASHIALETPFEGPGLKKGLPAAAGDFPDAPHEILLKGYEATCDPFNDTDGKERNMARVTWWLDATAPVLRDRPQVIGHYWNLPPLDGTFCPPHPSGTPALRAWQDKSAPRIQGNGRRALIGDIACVDFNGLTCASKERACVGALRWPEREVVWAISERKNA